MNPEQSRIIDKKEEKVFLCPSLFFHVGKIAAEKVAVGGKDFSVDQASKAASALKNLTFKLETAAEKNADGKNLDVGKIAEGKLALGGKFLSVDEASRAASALKNLTFKPEGGNAAEKNANGKDINVEKIATGGKIFSVDEASKAASALKNLTFKLEGLNATTAAEKNATDTVGKSINEKNPDVGNVAVGEKIFSVDEASKAASALKNFASKLENAQSSPFAAGGKILSVDEASKAASALKNLTSKFEKAQNSPAAAAVVGKNANVKIAAVVEKNAADGKIVVVAKNADGKNDVDAKSAAAEGKILTVDQASKAASALKNLMTNLGAQNSTHVEKFYVDVKKTADVKISTVDDVKKAENSVFKLETTEKNAKISAAKDEKNDSGKPEIPTEKTDSPTENSSGEKKVDVLPKSNVAEEVKAENVRTSTENSTTDDDVQILAENVDGQACRNVTNFKMALNFLKSSCWRMEKLDKILKSDQLDDQKFQKLKNTFDNWRKIHANFRNLLQFFQDDLKIDAEIFKKICVSSLEKSAKNLRQELKSTLEYLENEKPEAFWFFSQTSKNDDSAAADVKFPPDVKKPDFKFCLPSPSCSSPAGVFDELAYKLVILAYEKFNVHFKVKVLAANLSKKKSKTSAKWRRIENFLFETFENWQKSGYSMERCQKFLTLLCCLVHWETLPPTLNADAASTIMERAGRAMSHTLLLSRKVPAAEPGRDPGARWPPPQVLDQARRIVGDVSGGFLIHLMLQK
uniref:Uncharacterized protein n=1 Tax=Romanomermis culicivorax TaxID=13658 RepID=A0A915L258_ROMCU